MYSSMMTVQPVVVPVARRRPRRRQSLNELDPTKSPANVRRHSTGQHEQQPLERSLLEHVQLEFVKAIVPESKLAARPRYVLKVTNTALDQSWEMARPFSDFWDWKEAMLRVLERGHACNSNCPWLYVYCAHNFPRRHLFRARRSTVIASRLTDLQEFFTTILKSIKEQRPTDCAISSEELPRILYDFLFQGMIFDRSDFNNTVLETRMSMTRASRHSSKEDLAKTKPSSSLCSICELPLRQLEGLGSSPPGSESCSTMSSSSPEHDHSHLSKASFCRQSSISVLAGITTLDCGHQFHDECILFKLNEHLQCPRCTHARAHPSTDATD